MEGEKAMDFMCGNVVVEKEKASNDAMKVLTDYIVKNERKGDKMHA